MSVALAKVLQKLLIALSSGGFAVGFLSLIIPVYLAEFAPASIRGRLVGFFDICAYLPFPCIELSLTKQCSHSSRHIGRILDQLRH